MTGAGGDTLFGPPPAAETERMIEALLFASAEPMRPDELARRLPEGAAVNDALERLAGRYAGCGVVMVRVGRAWAFRTAPDLGHLMHVETEARRKLSRAGLETLAIIAYHQPVTRPEIEEIRGVTVSRGTIDTLMELGWIGLGRRRMAPGRPVTYVTTDGFLDHFGLESARDLPGLKELREAGLLDNRPPPGHAGPADEADETLFDDTGDGEIQE